MKTALIISTYNQHEQLRKSLLGVLAQTERNFETIVADDGSTPETAEAIAQPEFAPLRIKHVWIPDRGWRKPRVMNLAVAQTDADYCVFLDGDTIPRNDYVESHLRNSRPQCYLSGARINIVPELHERLTDDDILSNRVFDLKYLTARDPRMLRYRYRLGRSPLAPLYNALTYRAWVWFGSNSSAWRKDILAVNGFNETFSYGSDDREFGLRMRNAGIRSRYLKFSLIQLHLDHPTNPNVAQARRNRWRFRKVFFTRQTRSPLGIDTVLERDAAEREEFAYIHEPCAA